MTLRLLLFLVLACVACAQQTVTTGLRIETTTTPDVFKLTWPGLSGYTYFIQTSEDLKTWTYLPIIESGTGDAIEYGFTSTADAAFFRLHFTSQATTDPLTADFDHDGVSNWDELQQGLDPFKPDSDGDGMPDGYELTNGLNPALADGTDDLDSDGVPNQADARPNDSSIGRLSITIITPADGILIQ